jgi:hypothetical protein
MTKYEFEYDDERKRVRKLTLQIFNDIIEKR